MKKVKIAVPYVQWDVYEVEIDDNAANDTALEQFADGPDECYRKLGTLNVEPLQDYLEEWAPTARPHSTFVVDEELIEKFTWAIGG